MSNHLQQFRLNPVRKRDAVSYVRPSLPHSTLWLAKCDVSKRRCRRGLTVSVVYVAVVVAAVYVAVFVDVAFVVAGAVAVDVTTVMYSLVCL